MSAPTETVTRGKGFTSGAAIEKHRRVTLSSGTVIKAGEGDPGLGPAKETILADSGQLGSPVVGDQVGVDLPTAQGTLIMVAAGIVAVGAAVYAAADGKVNDVAIGPRIGIALTAAGADGDEIEVLPMPDGLYAIVQDVDHADFTDSTGASGYLDLDDQLPAGALVESWKFIGTEGFAGDTTAVIQVGVSGDADRFSTLTTNSVFATATVGAGAPAASANAFCAAATTVRVTVTGGSDWGSVSAGAGKMIVYYRLR